MLFDRHSMIRNTFLGSAAAFVLGEAQLEGRQPQSKRYGGVSLATTVTSPMTQLPARERWGPSTGACTTLFSTLDSPFEPSSFRPTSHGGGILVIDDEATIRTMVSDVLLSEGYVVWSAKNGAEALAVLDRARPSLAILDMRMPILNGWGFARILRERRIWLPVLVMTAAVDGQRWADEIGAAGCVTKPFDFLDLLAEVERLVPPR
jgi:two-component system, chemotaxis family, chemotaxis protein CheY